MPRTLGDVTLVTFVTFILKREYISVGGQAEVMLLDEN